MDNLKPELIIAFLIVAIGVVGLFLYKKWTNKRSGQRSNKQTTTLSSSTTSDDAKNALAEAEVCLAYGRKKQAVQLLEQAARENPSRTDILAKLDEIKQSL